MSLINPVIISLFLIGGGTLKALTLPTEVKVETNCGACDQKGVTSCHIALKSRDGILWRSPAVKVWVQNHYMSEVNQRDCNWSRDLFLALNNTRFSLNELQEVYTIRIEDSRCIKKQETDDLQEWNYTARLKLEGWDIISPVSGGQVTSGVKGKYWAEYLCENQLPKILRSMNGSKLRRH